MDKLIEQYTAVLKKYDDFEGRSGRAEYWTFFLVNFAISTLLSIFGTVFGFFLGSIVPLLFSFFILLPGIAVGVRRLHDTGRSGLLLLVAFVPIIGWLALLYLLVQESQPGQNEYGAQSQ